MNSNLKLYIGHELNPELGGVEKGGGHDERGCDGDQGRRRGLGVADAREAPRGCPDGPTGARKLVNWT